MDAILSKRVDAAVARARIAASVEKRAVGSPAGKGLLADALIKLFPAHKAYTEVFAGGAAVFWAKDKSASTIEVLNDYNSEVAHAFKFAQGITDDQIKRLMAKNWIGEKELFKRLRDSSPSDPLERFYRFLYLRKAGFGRMETSIAPDKVGKHVAKTLGDRLPAFRERLKGVKIYHGDYMTPLKKYDSPDTLHFMDPPFPSFDLKLGEKEWDEERYLKALYDLKGNWILTYETRKELNDELRKKFHVEEWKAPTNVGFNANQKRSPTTVATNFKVKKSIQVPDEIRKGLSEKQKAEFEAESAKIRENAKKPEAKKQHRFKAAQWTHPNGHPRCLICGGEETMSGYCNAPTKVEQAVSDRFDELWAANPDHDIVKDWDRVLNQARNERGVTTKTADAIFTAPARVIEAVMKGADRLVLDRKRAVAGKALLLEDEHGEAHGVIKLGQPERLDLWKFAERSAEHGISEPERSALWPDVKAVWSYPVESLEKEDEAKVAMSDEDVAALEKAQYLAAELQAAVPPFVERTSRFLQEGETLSFMRTLKTRVANLSKALHSIKAGDIAEAKKSFAAVQIAKELQPLLKRLSAKLPDSAIKNAIDSGIDTVEELIRISQEELTRDGGHIKEARDTAPVNPSGKKIGSEIQLADVLEHAQPIILRRGAVSLVGGVVNWGKSKNDVDLLIKGPLDEGTAHVLQFRLGRMMPEELRRRVQFLRDDELGGPFTDHVELYDLALVPRSHRIVEGEGQTAFKVVEMRCVEKASDPLMDLPAKRGKYPATFQFHFRGRSLHADIRMAVNDHLIGWTIANAKPGKLPQVSELREARRFARRYDPDGNFFLKDWTAPEGLYATPKTKMPKAWLDIVDEKFEPGEIGATANEPGVIVRVTDSGLRVEYGLQKAWAHEYFFTGDSKFTGRLFFRLLRGRGGPASEEEAGRATPEGENYWRSFWAAELLPSVLNRRAVQTKSMPPDGYSAIPTSLESVIPKEHRYWEAKGEEARHIRDALVESKFLTKDNVKIVDGEFRRIVTKMFLDLGGSKIAKADRVPYSLLWQFWKGQRVVRSGPSREVWHLVFKASAGKWHAFKLQGDPLAGSRVAGTHRDLTSGDLADFEGTVDPGQKIGGEVLNDTRATPSWIRRVDQGQVEILESDAGSFQVRFRGGKLRGDWAITQEEEGSDFWIMQREGEAAKSTESAGANLFADRGGYSYIACPPCGSVNLRLAKSESSRSIVSCNECGASFAVPATVHDRNSVYVAAEKSAAARGREAETEIAVLEELLAEAGLDDDIDYEMLKAVPVVDGVQRWDPARKDPDADRSQLRPLAIYQPQKVAPRDTNEFRDKDSIFEHFATASMLSDGIMVEPKYNGFRLSLQKRGDRVLIFTEDEKRDLSKVLPGLTEELQKIRGDFVLDGEGMAVDKSGDFIPRRDLAQFRGKSPVDDSGLRIPIFRALYLPDGNVTAKSELDCRRALEKFFKRSHGKRIFLAPFKLAKNRDELLAGIDWATRQPGSEGAMMKHIGATYSLGGENDGWAKFKASRNIKAIVHKRDQVKDSPGVYNFHGAIGPIPNPDDWADTVEVAGKTWIPMGKTFNSKEKLSIGDFMEVEATEILFDQSREKKTLRWFTPTVIGPAKKASTVKEVLSMVRPDEVKKLMDLALEKHIQLIKADSQSEERFVLGIVLEPNDGEDGAPLDADSQKDIYSKEAIREAAHRFMEHYRNTGVMHRENANERIKILESYVAPCQLTIGRTKIREGTWLLAVRVLDDELWAKVKQEELTGFSIGGSALRSPADQAAQ